ncbi:dehydroquinase class I [Chthoniobacter flavus Ellin428]|uniref:3-dehydroquinate dehydratase n=1 Tax=Chthoniobacter flavus Ellin428 TaxID=497964 RepID=B4D6S5_9BACT|nr:type I 3-dehydroquinate dehydratase [Chthoniobacter flavus]EDY17876.1 dehydroquinase class I [Chthoniobacter flavus Ellin428]TCO88486.1 3-dehydroquinate dehydratase [Chthoniobacter flavus]
MSRTKNSRDLRKSPHVVGAVHSPGALQAALKIQPGEVDFLEIRVDNFATAPAPLLAALPKLQVPLLVTVRHPAEGGANALGFPQRRELFARFLPHAALIDIELRSFEKLAETIAAARRAKVKVIASVHHFHSMPSTAKLEQSIRRAHAAGADICKLAALAETPAALANLLGIFAKKHALPLSVMGMGRFGKISRLLLAQAGSVLNYGYLDRPNASGQWEARLLKSRLAELIEI